MKFILSSDFHLRTDNPICRLDNFQEVQKDTVRYIFGLVEKYKAKLVIAGDIFHKARPERPQELESMMTEYLVQHSTAFIAGQHDLLYHKVGNLMKGSLGVLEPLNNKYNKDNFENKINFFNFGEEIFQPEESGSIAVIHRYVDKYSVPEFMDDGITAEELLNQYNYDVFVCGDNHNGFVFEKDGRIVFNCGCITRQNADKKDYKPRVYLFDTDTREYETLFLPDCDPGVITDQHLLKLQEREDRVVSFVEKLKGKVDLNLSFEDNLDKYCKENNISDEVKEKINLSLGEIK